MHHEQIPNSETSDENGFQRQQINFSTQQNGQRTAKRISISKGALQRRKKGTNDVDNVIFA